jgi:hypothetical protein
MEPAVIWLNQISPQALRHTNGVHSHERSQCKVKARMPTIPPLLVEAKRSLGGSNSRP